MNDYLQSWSGNFGVHRPHIDLVMPLNARGSLNYGTSCRMILLSDSENRMIVASFIWTQYGNVTERRTDGRTVGRTGPWLIQRLHCKQCGPAVKIVIFPERIAWLSLNFVQTILSIAQHMIHVQGHKVNYLNRNNSAADCSISLKFGTEFDHGTASIVQMFRVRSKVKGQGHSVK